MDFFSAQDLARRKTWQLALLFGAAVVCLVVLTNLLVAGVYAWTAGYAMPGQLDLQAVLTGLPLRYWIWISLGVLGMVALASGYKYLQVRGGGRAIAESLGGRLLNHATADLGERRLLNVVEEMAIASGIPVPPVYLIEEPSINAFAAGFGPDDAVIGVNRGTIAHLTRDELQGVIGHEFSHLLNGDSRLNLRLVAVLHGILFIGLVGRGLLQGLGRGSGRRRGGGNGGAPVLALGAGLLVIGYAGTFFGNLIKAAVSRQREYLADAASVQFTRNPSGIAGALKKIGGLSTGSTMTLSAAGEVSHMFFGQAWPRRWFGGLMATHPPLERRIIAVDPGWNGRFPELAASPEAAAPQAPPAQASGFGPGAAADEPAAEVLDIHATPEAVTAAVGRMAAADLRHATAVIDALVPDLRDAAHDAFSARALMYALVIAPPGEDRTRQFDLLAGAAERGVATETARLLPATGALDASQRLTLIEMAMPALKTLSDPQYRVFLANLVALIKADLRIDLMEWVLHRLLMKELKPHFEGPVRLPVRRLGMASLGARAAVLISALAREDAADPAAAQAAFAAGMAALELDGDFDAAADPDFSRLNAALAELRTLPPLQKPRLVKACAATALADGRAGVRQAALLQGIAATLDCPLPPALLQPAAVHG